MILNRMLPRQPCKCFSKTTKMTDFKASEEHIKELEHEWNKQIEKDIKYWRENDVKVRAITSVESYDEFQDLVKASHLQPLTRKEILEMKDKKLSRNTQGPARTSFCTKPVLENPTPECAEMFPKSPAEFSKTWRKCNKNAKVDLLRRIPLPTLRHFLSAECYPEFLSDVINIITPASEENEIIWQAQFLEILKNSSRFKINTQFLTFHEQHLFHNLLDNVKQKSQEGEFNTLIEK